MELVLALDNVRSLHNVGAIFRSADGAGVSRIVLGGLTPTPPRHEISKTALGACESVPWEYCRDLVKCISELKLRGYTVYALELTPTAVPIFDVKLNEPAVLIVGHEREGVQTEILALCDVHLSLPMHGKCVSLNVATATGVAVYEFYRQSMS